MTKHFVPLVALILAGTMTGQAQVQPLTSRTPAPEDVATLDGILAAFYDVVSGPAGQARDWGRDSTLYTAGVRFVYEGRKGWQSVDHGTYAREAGPFLARGFYEREIHRTVQRFGDMVQVFSTYQWSRPGPDGPERGRGINSIELIHSGDRWWVTFAQWTEETPEHPIPGRYLLSDR